MSTASSVEGTNGGAQDSDTPAPNLKSDIACCEMCISLAARAGVRIPEYMLRAVKAAHAELEAAKVSPETESAFYNAMAYIVAHAPYPSAKVADDLRHCEEVVSHAGLVGKPISRADIEALSVARQAQRDFTWSATVEVPFYDAMSRMTHAVAPVVGETVGEEARKGARRSIKNYSVSAAALTFFVLVLSCLLFVIKEISDDVKDVIQKNDPIALMMHNQLQAYAAALTKANGNSSEDVLAQMQNSPEAVAIKDTLQKFATNNRQLYSDIQRTKTISRLFFWVPNSIGEQVFAFFGQPWGEDWGMVPSQYAKDCGKPEIAGVPDDSFNFSNGLKYGFRLLWPTPPPAADWECTIDSVRHALEIDLPLFDIGMTPDKKAMIPDDTVKQGFQKIAIYQQIRATANYARDNILTFVGMTTGFILPILYAWLGATAAILRKLRDDTAACLFHPEYSKVANRSHVTTAVIVGISIGLFSDLVHGGKELSPLAIAFVAGYASDRFFQFVDRLVQALFPSDAGQKLKSTEQKRDGQTRPGGAPRPVQS
ncbi:hypothetical protein J8I87_11010 [Paraburkholderia sp. LEh10]|uniref:hypothetical protein n=1 Tax=Paraburkholderia sp. LEh10 TaxID=2821353 RepID=UPI001AE9D0DB|nr:hypothetical protein [Paraburkholderia sp. LEh10]MBP0590232.1 hypothetical protein [Paraburkholderia sp. LEh10]